MALLQLFRILFSFVTAISLLRADNATYEYDSDIDNSVVIGPVENISAYFNGSTNIVLTWDPPPVYLIHDVINASFDQITKEGLVVSEHPSSAINKSANSSNMSTFDAVVASNQNNGTEDDISSFSNTTNCRPISFFSNYTVAMKEDPDHSDHEMVIAFKDSVKDNQLRIITPKDNQKIVDFSKGCLTSYIVSWNEANSTSAAVYVSLPPISSTVNITGLKPATQYKIIITTVFISGDRFENKPPAFFTTKRSDDVKDCQCDMHGTTMPIHSCTNRTGPIYCSCKRGYTGTFCERCAPGYYNSGKHFPCNRCPCYLFSTRNSSCRFNEGFLQCDSCDVGYTGNLCNVCDDGFYKVSQQCYPCFCSGNSSPDEPKMCDPETGMCFKCLHNTTGPHCEQCLTGYIRDGVNFKSCTLEEEVRAHNLKSSSLSPGVVAAVVITVTLVLLLTVAVVLFRRYHSKEKLRAFWTIEMRRDRDDVDFNSVHNDDARLDDADDVDYFSKRGVSSSSSKYSRLQEEI